MRTLAIGDIHGGLKALQQLLQRIDINQDDNFIFLGDYVDGWSEAAQVIQFLIGFSTQYDCVFIKGNHDIWCEDWLKTGEGEQVWLMHGGKETVDSYALFSEDEKQKHLEFFQQMKPYYIDNENRLLIHAGFTSMHGVEKETFTKNYYFDRTLWEMARILNMVDKEKHKKIDSRLSHYHEIYIGHTPTTRFNSDIPVQAVNLWNIDTGAAFKGKLSAIDIDTKEFFQSDNVYTLYPNEIGRNK